MTKIKSHYMDINHERHFRVEVLTPAPRPHNENAVVHLRAEQLLLIQIANDLIAKASKLGLFIESYEDPACFPTFNQTKLV